MESLAATDKDQGEPARAVKLPMPIRRSWPPKNIRREYEERDGELWLTREDVTY